MCDIGLLDLVPMLILECVVRVVSALVIVLGARVCVKFTVNVNVNHGVCVDVSCNATVSLKC